MFGIPTYERKKFNDSFLRSISMTVRYELNPDIERNAVNFYSQIENRYPIKSDKSISAIRVGEKIRTTTADKNNSQVVYKSEDTYDEIRYSPTEYRLLSMITEYSGFESYLNQFEELIQPLKESGVSMIDGISLVKLNALNFQLKVDKEGQEEDSNPIYRMAPISRLLKNGLIMNDGIAQTLNGSILKYRNSINLQGEAGHYLTIDFDTSITNVDPNGEFVDGVVSIQFNIRRNSPVAIESLRGEYIRLNQEIFNAFMWILSDYGKNLLNNVG